MPVGKKQGQVKQQDMPKYLITGAGGTLGMEFFKQLEGDVIGIDNNEWAVAEMDNDNIKLGDFVNTLHSDLYERTIIHCAAYKHVDLCEKNQGACMENNVQKTAQFLNFALTRARDFIFISSDKAVEPESYYGETKKEIENAIIRTGFGKVVRLGNIYGSSGSVIPIWEKQIREGKPLTITDPKMTRYFIKVNDAVAKILELIPEASGGQIIIPDMQGAITLEELKNRVLALHNLSKEYPIKIIGIRPGEKKHEKLINKNEKEVKHIKDVGTIYEEV